ncbi:MAG: DUF374 domain-containing protein [Planctomycetota bacterium]|nr:MAG: DUF374 domain-containing protein [Planctomycetota bacterium]
MLWRLLASVLCFFAATWRYRVAGWEDFAPLVRRGEPIVGAMFHGRLLCMMGFFGRPGRGPWTVMVSRSRDGDRLAAVLSALGFGLIRGSSGRGGVQAYRQSIQAMVDGSHPRLCLAVDGSKGPRYLAKSGALGVCSRAGAWLVSVHAVADRAIVLRRAWDHTVIPLPWARISLHCSQPIRLPSHLDHAAIERLQPRLQALMSAQRRRLDNRRIWEP